MHDFCKICRQQVSPWIDAEVCQQHIDGNFRWFVAVNEQIAHGRRHRAGESLKLWRNRSAHRQSDRPPRGTQKKAQHSCIETGFKNIH